MHSGGIAEAFYGGVPPHIQTKAMGLLTPGLRAITENFRRKYIEK
jgi:hypothetical protein